MQMLCKVAVGFSDVRCPVCGQGFLVYWTRQREVSRTEQRQALQHSLRAQHTGADASDIHAPAFHLPDAPAVLPQVLAQPAIPVGVPIYS